MAGSSSANTPHRSSGQCQAGTSVCHWSVSIYISQSGPSHGPINIELSEAATEVVRRLGYESVRLPNSDCERTKLTSLPTSVSSPNRLCENCKNAAPPWHSCIQIITYHCPTAAVPSGRSTTRLIGSSSGTVAASAPSLATEALSLRAVLQNIQCSGMFAGGSAIRTPTGVRSPIHTARNRVQRRH